MRPSTSFRRSARRRRSTAVRFRRGWFLGDGTGAGKGRQVAGILLDNWLKGRRRAVWVSKSDKLIEDAQRDWSALGQERLLITPLARFRQGTPIRLDEGILFTTYATLRSDAREEKVSRVRQIVDWLGSDFDGVIVFDESHAMQNAAGGKSERGDQAPSQQGRAGLRLQHALPDARVLYVSATGATTVAQSRLCPAARPVGRRGFPLRHPCRVRRGDRGRRRRGHGGARPRPEGARPLRGPLALLRGDRIRARRAPAHPRADPHLRRLCRRLPGHPQQPDRGAGSRQRHRRDRDAERPGQVGRALGLRERQAALLQSPHHRDEDPGADRRGRARSRSRPCRRHPDRLHRRGADGAAPRRDPDRGMGRRAGRHHAARIRSRLPGARLPDPAVRAVHRRRGQSLVAAGLSRRPAGPMPRGRGTARPHDRAPGVARPRPGRARPDRAALRHRHGGGGHRPLAAHRAQGGIGRSRPSRGRGPRRLGQSRRGAGLHG